MMYHPFMLALVAFLLCDREVEAVLLNIRPYQSAILQAHNFYRSIEPAANMRYMTWDYRLQQLAARWSENCYFEHQRVGGLGENLSYFSSSGFRSVAPRTVIQQSLALWAGEKRIWRYSRSCGRACHYTQMIWATTSRVGCSLSYCPIMRVGFGSVQRNAMYLVCKYYPAGNIIGQYPFIFGRRCSRCGYGARCIRGLCAGGGYGGFGWPGFRRPRFGYRRFGPFRRFGRRRRSVKLSEKEKFLELVHVSDKSTNI